MNRKENLNTDFNDASRILSESIPEDRFSEPEGIVAVLNRYSYLRSQAESISKGILFRIGVRSRQLRDSCKSFRTNYDSLAERSHEHNEKMALSLVPEVSETIGDVEGFPLDSQQTSAIAKDVHTRLVLAGAGTGKTTTIIGLAKYLILSKKAEPEDILFLSFTNATVSDLSRRMLKEVGMRLDVCTFHRLGMRILAESDGKVPRVSSIDTESFVRNELLGLMSDDRYLRDLDRYMAFDSRYAFDEDDFDNETDYQKFIKENPLVTLDGKTVKSLGEADIANWLYMHDIPYAYEEPYPVDTRTSEYGQYHPDFHIRDTNVYIEYFGVDRRGNVAPFMKSNHGNDASAEYRAGMEWKTRTHSENGTTLIPLYSYQRSDDSLLDELEKGLRNTGVKVGSRNPSEIFSSLSNGNSFALDKVVREFSTAMILVKENGQPLQESLSGGSGIRERRVLKRVVRLLEPIYNSYQRTLRDRDEIDFEDVLNLASDRVNSGGYVPAYRYVIVDEYQDISRSRYNLLRSLRESHDFKLFCVGDDWQSIYRFNGSDVNYILDFEKYWGPSETCRIERTYRFSGELLRVSNAFMNSTSGQIHKNLRGDPSFDTNVVFIRENSPASCARSVARLVDSIPVNESILFLSRFRHDIVSLENGGFRWKPDVGGRTFTVTRTNSDRKITFMTIHGSKGIQADHVFILNNKRGPGGFPDMRGESILIKSLLNGHGDKLADERRLFYVALTRARKSVHLVSLNGSESEYLKECVYYLKVK